MLVLAHVKWFAETSFASVPLSLGEAVTPAFLALAALSIVTIALLVLLDSRIGELGWYRSVDAWLEARRDQSLLAMRIAAWAVLLMNWQADAMLVPEFSVTASWIGWFQLVLALLLLFPRTTPEAGAGMILLYLLAVGQNGIFHMLDYLHYLGVGYFLAVSRGGTKLRASGLPALYASVGFSLCWLALEKVVYPQWGLVLLEEHPQLALGFPIEFFLLGAAFVEFSLGYLLIIGVLGRPLALTITVVFFFTTLVFGKTEVIGHTLLHGALIVFLLEGTGHVYRPPIAFHRKMGLRLAFGGVNFAVLLGVLLVAYTSVAQEVYRSFDGPLPHGHEKIDVSGEGAPPSVDGSIARDSESGFNVELRVENFRWAPENAGGAHVMPEGHAHVEIDGRKIARWYGPWGHLPELPPGEYRIRVSLNTNDHREYALGGDPIDWTTTLTVE